MEAALADLPGKTAGARAGKKSMKADAAAPIQFGVPSAAAVEPDTTVPDMLIETDAASYAMADTVDVVAPPVIASPAAAPEPAEVLAAGAAVVDAQPATAPDSPAFHTDAPTNEGPTMTDTFTKIEDTTTTAAHDATAKAGAFMHDATGRAKDAMEKGTKAIEELVEFSKGNLEAMMTSGRVAAKGAEEIAKYSAEYGRATIEKANATARQFAAIKSPTEFFQLQGELAKQTLDAVVAEGSKFTEAYLKLIGEVSQPISSRVAVAVDKVKSSTAG